MDYNSGILRPISMDAVRTCPPYGIYLLATIAEAAGHEVTVVDLIAQGSKDLSLYSRELMTCHLVGVGTSSLSWPTAKDCIAEIKHCRPDVPIVVGGIHATMFDKYILSTTETTFVLRGEAESTFPLLCRTLEQNGNLLDIPNLTFRMSNSRIVRNETALKMSDRELAEFPVPDYSRLPSGVYTGLGLESSRGCPFDCVFCSTSYRKSWRGIDSLEFVDRLERILPFTTRTILGLVQIIDDEFSIKTRRAVDICNEIGNRNIKTKLVFDSRADDLTNETFVDAIQPYAHQFLVGAECGYDEGLTKIGKGTTTEKLKQAASMLKRKGMASRADFSFIIGLPWETKSEVIQTIRFAYKLYETYGVRVLLQWYCQIPGSRLWDEQREKEVLHEAHYDDYGFFRNHYLFRTGVKLTPSEVHEVVGILNSIQSLSSKNVNGMDMVQSSAPDPILTNYPILFTDKKTGGLTNLREAAGAKHGVMQ
jgi:radical SAM superfamily enzyme YgiQ (UPF0313 family)